MPGQWGHRTEICGCKKSTLHTATARSSSFHDLTNRLLCFCLHPIISSLHIFPKWSNSLQERSISFPSWQNNKEKLQGHMWLPLVTTIRRVGGYWLYLVQWMTAQTSITPNRMCKYTEMCFLSFFLSFFMSNSCGTKAIKRTCVYTEFTLFYVVLDTRSLYLFHSKP